MSDLVEDNVVEQVKGRSRLALIAGLVVVVILVAAAVAGFFIIRGNEESYLADGKAAIAAGDWQTAVESLGKAIDTQPAFLRQHEIEARALRGLAHFQLGSDEAALADFDAALAGRPEWVDVQAYRGHILFHQGDSDGALEGFEAALAHEDLLPEHLQALAHADQAAYFYGRGDNEQGEQEASAAILVDNHIPDENLAGLYAAGTHGSYQAGDMEATLANGLAALSFEGELGDGDRAKVLADMAQAYFREDQLTLALESGAKALELDGLEEEQLASLHAMQAGALYRQGELEEAISEAQQAVDNGQGEAQLHGLQALRAYRAGDWDGAMEEAEVALALDENNGLAHRVQGTIYLWQGYHDEALAELDAAIALDKTDVEALAIRVYAWLEENNLEAAEADLAQAQAANPAAPATLFAEAQVDLYYYEFSSANVLMNKAIEVDGDRPEFFVYRAWTLPKVTQRDQRFSDLEQAFSLDTDLPMALSAMIEDKYSQYDYQNIEDAAAELVSKYPQRPEGYEFLAHYYGSVVGDQDTAMTNVEKGLEVSPESHRGYITRGYVHLDNEAYDLAQADFEQALKLSPTSIHAIKGLAYLYWYQEQTEMALEELDQVLAAWPEDAPAYLLQAWIHADLGDMESAWQKVHEALAIDPDFPEALRFRAMMNYESGNLSQAQSDVERALEIYPRYPSAHLTAAWIYSDQGQVNDARESAERALELDEDLTDAYRLLMNESWNENDLEEIESLARRWVEADPESIEALNWLSQSLSMQGKDQEALDTLEVIFDSFTEDDPQLPNAYFIRAMTYLDLGDDAAYTADLSAALEPATDLEFIDQVEVLLARPGMQTVDDRAVIEDTAGGFTISISQEWDYYPAEPEEGYFLSLGYSEEYILASVDLYVIDWDPSFSIDALAAAILPSGEGVITSGPDPITIAGESGLVQHYEFEDDFGDYLFGHQYIVANGSRVAVIEVWADEDVIEAFEIEFETMIASFGFLQ